MTINLSMPATHQLKPRITVVGVGGAGGNAVNNMITSHLEGVDFIAANTDAQALAQSLSERRVQLGVTITQGLGAGSRPDVGSAAAEEAIDELADHLEGSNMVFITAGLGGGTGTGASSVVARMAREQGILTVAVVTKPFQFEGANRMRIAEEGILELQQYVDTLIIIPNQNLFRVANEKTTFADAFKMADDVLYSGVRGVTDLMVMPGLINLDFADVRTVMAEMGKAMMGTGEAEDERRAIEAAESAISNPLLDDVSMKGARGVLINITGGYDMTLFEVDEAANRIREEVDVDANIIFGSTFDESLASKMRVSVVATGIDASGEARARPVLAMVRNEPETAETAELEAAADFPPAAWGDAGDTDPEPAPVAAVEASQQAAPQPAADPEAVETAPQPVDEADARGDSFVPPPPVQPGRAEPLTAQAEPFAAAAMANGAQSAPEPSRGRTLFERVTGAGRAPAPRAGPTPAAPTSPAAQAAAPAAGLTLPKAEEDLLEIPAFLRRQAN